MPAERRKVFKLKFFKLFKTHILQAIKFPIVLFDSVKRMAHLKLNCVMFAFVKLKFA